MKVGSKEGKKEAASVWVFGLGYMLGSDFKCTMTGKSEVLEEGIGNISGNENPRETLRFTSPEVWESVLLNSSVLFQSAATALLEISVKIERFQTKSE